MRTKLQNQSSSNWLRIACALFVCLSSVTFCGCTTAKHSSDPIRLRLNAAGLYEVQGVPLADASSALNR
jgi:hypothetical protein